MLNRTSLLTAALISVVTFTATSVDAAVIYSKTFNAPDLLSDADVVIQPDGNPDRIPALINHAPVNGLTQSVHFGVSQGNRSNSSFMKINIADAGELDDNEQYFMSVSVTQNRALGTSDQDLRVHAFDTNNLIGVIHQDHTQDQDSFYYEEGFADQDNVVNRTRLELLALEAPSNHFSYFLNLGLVESLLLTSPTQVGPTITTAAFDVSQGLSLRFIGNNPGEQYAISQVSITLATSEADFVPTPGAFALLGFGLLGLGLRRRLS